MGGIVKGIFGISDEPEVVEQTGLTASEEESLAEEEAKRKANKKSQAKTQTTLTSPMGASTTPNTASKTLG